MVKLVATSPAAGLVPLRHGSVMLSEVEATHITSVAPLDGKAKSVSAALKKAIGAEFPDPNRMTGKDGARVVWTGPGQAMVLGPEVALKGAALTDQSDAWTWLVLEGTDAAAVLARLTPVDLRDSVFEVGHAARTLLFHMTATLIRTGAERWEILVFRSMAKTAVHDLEEAMRSVAAQAGR